MNTGAAESDRTGLTLGSTSPGPAATGEKPANWPHRAFFIFSATFLFGMILFLALITYSGRESPPPRRQEGELLMESARNFLRVEYSKHGNAEATRESLRLAVAKGRVNGGYFFVGRYFSISPELEFTAAGATIHTEMGEDGVEGDGTGYMSFEWASGNSTTTWRP